MKLPRSLRWIENPWRIAFGPVFQKEVYVSGRRNLTYIVRSSVAILLFIVLVLACVPLVFETSVEQGVARLQRSQGLAISLTAVVICFDFAILLLFTPILIAPAVMEEVRQRTLPALLTTPITAAEIIVGKLLGRGVNLFILALVPLPVLLVLRTLGGVPGDAVFMALAMIVSATAMIASLSILVSVWLRKPASAIVAAFIFFIGIQGIPPAVLAVCVHQLHLFSIPTEVILSLSVFPSLAFSFVERLGGGGGMPFAVDMLWIWNTLYNVAISTVLLVAAIALLRRVMRKEGAGETVSSKSSAAPVRRRRKLPSRSPIPARGDLRQVESLAKCASCGRVLANQIQSNASNVAAICPECEHHSSALAGSHLPRIVGDQPVLWRELRQPVFHRRWHWWVAILAAIGLTAFTFFVAIESPGEAMKLALGVGMALCLLSAAVMTTSSIGTERDSQTWDVLLTTALSADEILWGKLLGTLSRQAIIPGIGAVFLLVVGVFILHLTHPVELLFWLLQTGGPICFLSASGVVLSLFFRKSTVAAVWNLSLALFIWAGLPAIVRLVSFPLERAFLQNGHEFSDHLLAAVLAVNPFFIFAESISSGSGGNYSTWHSGAQINFIGVVHFTLVEFFSLTVAVALAYLAAAWALMYLAKAQFASLSGRVSTGQATSKSTSQNSR